MKKNGNQNYKRKKQEVDILIENEDGTEITTTEEINIKTHPDGEWGWCVVMAAFLTQFVVVGLQNSSGVIFNELVEKFNRPRGETGFVSSISCGMMFILGPITTSLCQRFGCRLIATTGGLLCMAGMAASAHASSLKIMYVTFGLTWGLGTSFCYFPTLIILVPYFNTKLSLVNGIVSAGSGVGTLVLSPFIQWFARKYGVKNMFYMLASLHGLVFLCGFVYRPIKMKYQKLQGYNDRVLHDTIDTNQNDALNTLINVEKGTIVYNEKYLQCEQDINKRNKKRKDKSQESVLMSLFRDKAFVAWCFGLSVFMLGYFVPFVHLVRYAKLIGIDEVKAAFLISTLSIVATIFKILSGKIAGLVYGMNKLKLYQVGLLTMGVATTLIPISHSYVGLVVYSVVFGISESCFIVMIPLITKEIVGVRRLPLALGCVFMLMGIPTVIGAPIAGWIYDVFQDYSYAFYVAGSMNTVGVLIMFLVSLFYEKDLIKKNRLNEETVVIEDKKERPKSQVLEFACFASSERIFYSQLNLADNENTKRLSKLLSYYYHSSNTSINLSERLFKDPHIDSLQNQNNDSSNKCGTGTNIIYRPESPSILKHRENKQLPKEARKTLNCFYNLFKSKKELVLANGDNKVTRFDTDYYTVDSRIANV